MMGVFLRTTTRIIGELRVTHTVNGASRRSKGRINRQF